VTRQDHLLHGCGWIGRGLREKRCGKEQSCSEGVQGFHGGEYSREKRSTTATRFSVFTCRKVCTQQVQRAGASAGRRDFGNRKPTAMIQMKPGKRVSGIRKRSLDRR